MPGLVLDAERRVDEGPVDGLQHLGRVEPLDVHALVRAVLASPQDQRPVRAHDVLRADADPVEQRDRHALAAAGAQHDLVPGGLGGAHGGGDGLGDDPVLAHRGAVDVERNEPALRPRRSSETRACTRNRANHAARSRARGNRATSSVSTTRSGSPATLRRPVDEPSLRTHRGSMTSTPPRYGRSTSGTTTEPSSCWCVSRIATIQRVVASVPFSVATGAVLPLSVR